MRRGRPAWAKARTGLCQHPSSPQCAFASPTALRYRCAAIPHARRMFTMKTYKIAAIPGDGIGKEVIAAGVEVLEALAARDRGFAFTFDHFDWGSDYYRRHGVMMPADGRDQIKDHDAIYF